MRLPDRTQRERSIGSDHILKEYFENHPNFMATTDPSLPRVSRRSCWSCQWRWGCQRVVMWRRRFRYFRWTEKNIKHLWLNILLRPWKYLEWHSFRIQPFANSKSKSCEWPNHWYSLDPTSWGRESINARRSSLRGPQCFCCCCNTAPEAEVSLILGSNQNSNRRRIFRANTTRKL